jgi:hypothetical protein
MVDDNTNQPDEGAAGDLLLGATRIAEHISTLVGETVNEGDVYYAHKTGKWPIGKLGAGLIASKRRLASHGNKIARGSTTA